MTTSMVFPVPSRTPRRGLTNTPHNQNLTAFKAFVYRGFEGFLLVFFDYIKV